MANRIQFRRDTLANWQKTNPILMEGELALIATDSSKPGVYDSKKIGDGVHHFNDLEMLGYECLQELGDSTQFPVSQKVVTELFETSNVIQLKGQGDTGVFKQLMGLFPNITYRVYIKNKWNAPTLADNFAIFELYYRNDDGTFTIFHRETNATNLKDYYEITLPKGKNLFIYARIVEGETATFALERMDTTIKDIDFQKNALNTYIVGKGIDYSPTRFRGQPGRLYRISLAKLQWNIPSDLTNSSIFYIGKTVNGIEQQLVSVQNFAELKSNYYIQFLEDYDYINIGGRANEGENIYILIEDITDNCKNNIVSSLSGLIGECIPMLNSGYVQRNDILNDNDIKFSINYLHTIIECKAGDLFSIQGRAGNAESLLMTFYDVNKNYLTSTAQGSDYSDKEFLFLCYKDGYICINVNNQYPYNIVKVNKNLLTNKNLNVNSYIRWSTGYVRHYNGTIATESQINKCTNYIPTFGYDKIKLLMPTTINSDLSTGLAFYDSNRNYISGYSGLINQSETGAIEQEITIPKGASLFRTTIGNNYVDLQNIILLKNEINIENINFDDNVSLLDAYINVESGELNSSTGNKTSIFSVKKGDTIYVRSLQHSDSGVFAFSKSIPEIGSKIDNIIPGRDAQNLNHYTITAQDDGYILFSYLWKRELSYENLTISSSHVYSSNKIDSLLKNSSPSSSFYNDSRNNFQFISLKAEDATDKSDWTANDIIENIYEPMRAAHPEYITRKSLGKDESGLYDIWCYEFNNSVDEWFSLSNSTNFYGTSVHVPLTNGLKSNQCEIKKSFLGQYITEDYVNLYIESTFNVRKPTLVIDKESVLYDGEEWFRFTCDSDIKIIESSSTGSKGFRLYWTKKINTFDQHAVIMSGAHGNESAGVLGVALALKYLTEHHNENSALAYIYNSVKLSVIPCLNMWGMNQTPHVRTNINGVNLNRYEGEMTAEQKIITNFIDKIKDEVSFFADFHTAEWWTNYGYVYSINSKHSKLYPAIVAVANYLCKHWFPKSPAYNWNIGTSSTTVNTNAKYMENVFKLNSATIEFAGYDLMYFGSCNRWDAKYMTYCVENYINFLMATCNLRLSNNSKNIIDESFFEHTTMS